MTYFDSSILKAVTDPTVPYTTRIIEVLQNDIFDFLIQYNKLAKEIKIINSSNKVVRYRTHSKSAPFLDVPIQSQATLEDWISFLEIETIDPIKMEVDLVDLKEARK